jgi:hypothetical protein
MEQFTIEACDDVKKHTFTVRALGNQWYEIYNIEGELVGKVKIDEETHEHCESDNREVDLPILNSIRKSIFLYKVYGEDPSLWPEE